MVQLPRPRDSGDDPGARPAGDGSIATLDAATIAGSMVSEALRQEDFVDAVLSATRSFLDMDVAFIGEFSQGSRIFRYVDNASGCAAVQVGAGDELELSYCQRVVDGRLPELINDAAALPAAADLVATRALPVGAHLSVPILLSDGTVYGTFCSFAHTPKDDLHVRDLAVMRMLAALVAGHLERQRDLRRQTEEDRTRVRQVIAEHAFRTVFQPIVDLRDNRVIGYEALTRFALGTPTDWFEMAARTGSAVALEMATLIAAVDEVASLPVGAYLAVNVSPDALCSPEFQDLVDILPLGRLVLELTEQTSVDRPDLLLRVDALRRRGARFAVDDAGAGYSGLQRILSVAPDIVKLDRDLISGIDRDAARQSLARAMCWFTERGGKVLVAEGIETAAERAALVRLGIRYGQGYLLGRPGALPEHDAVPMAEERPA
ncbi:EAL domain-containing protein [Nakamurella deserti]|uniref:sensor domain-containing phosphodiesterase n=1 Tax=Nakamurella deserti TaxID=2164074 RepID=UPI00147857C3|nr:EAL domain-containing protein [Nakamurella deserti]